MAEPETTAHPELTPPAPAWRPGDERPDVHAILRVDQAGEYGATRIYAGQLAVLGDRHPCSREIAKMAIQEDRHLKRFDELLAERGVRPTLLQPVWDVAGHALGAVTALVSPQAAMACTAAVETELAGTIAEFQAEELEHRDSAIAAGAEDAFGYPLLSAFIRAGCRAAIALSKRI
jgi:3-demethoxyubiquinol 3-hydroxylase